MVLTSIVQVSELKGAKRIDADRYQAKFLDLEKRLRNLKQVCPLLTLLQEPVKTGNTPKERELIDGEEKICFIKTDTLREGSIVFEYADFLPTKSRTRNSYLHPNDIITTIIGATFDIIGRTAIFLEGYPPSVVNQNIAIIRVYPQQINPFFLCMFLNSKYGREQLWMLSRQTEQVNLNCREVEDVIIPSFSESFQTEIESIFKESILAIADSKKHYLQAEERFLNATGLKTFKPQSTKTHLTNLAEIMNAKRIDAEYFKPYYKVVIKKITENPTGSAPLLDYAQNIQSEFDPTAFPDKKYSYVELADIEPSIGVIGNPEKIIGENAPNRARKLIKKGEVLVSRIEGSLQQVALVGQNEDGALASTGFFQLRAQHIDPEVLLVISKSVVMQSQLKRETTGTILTAVPDQSLEKITIPLLDKETQRDIKALIQMSHNDWNRGMTLFANAKMTIESAIEKGEKGTGK